jgi:hypothetical protein
LVGSKNDPGKKLSNQRGKELVLECGAIRLAIPPGFDRETLAVVLELLASKGSGR